MKAAQVFGGVLRDAPGDAAAHLARGRTLAAQGNLPGALRDFAAAARLRPDWPAPPLARGRALDAAGRAREADVAFRKAFELGDRSDWLRARVQGLGG